MIDHKVASIIQRQGDLIEGQAQLIDELNQKLAAAYASITSLQSQQNELAVQVATLVPVITPPVITPPVTPAT